MRFRPTIARPSGPSSRGFIASSTRAKRRTRPTRACKTAGSPHFHPHDRRHRRLSLWHGQGIPAREIGDRVGQRQISTTLGVYTHVLLSPEEVSEGPTVLP